MSEQYVSIHAPTKGATHSGRTGFNGKCVSIHAPTKGATGNSLRLSLISMFQSTLPRRERRSMNDMDRSGYTVSIHAPTKGATIPFIDVYRYGLLFQSTLPRRERQQFRPKIHSNFQQKSTNYHFIYLIFPFFHPLFFLHSTSFVHILECESPGIFMCASYSHSYIITKYIICCNSTIGTFFCFIYKSAPFL